LLEGEGFKEHHILCEPICISNSPSLEGSQEEQIEEDYSEQTNLGVVRENLPILNDLSLIESLLGSIQGRLTPPDIVPDKTDWYENPT